MARYPVLLLMLAPAAAQPVWQQRLPANAPPARFGHGMVYDSVRGEYLLFGGLQVPSQYLNDTWVWDGTDWRQRQPASAPGPRVGPQMAWDAARGRVVLFGGYNAGSLTADTWEWDGTSWLLQQPAASPPACYYGAMVFDGNRGSVLLFGGGTLPPGATGTWEWRGGNWTRLSPATSPPARVHHKMAWDARRGRVVLFGGAPSGAPGALSDTWEWDGTNWAAMSPAHRPSARLQMALAWDPFRERAVLFGGRPHPATSDFNDTWEWDGVDWTQRSAGTPPARAYAPMETDTRRHRLVIFGGYTVPVNDTWELETGPLARARPIGAGCSGCAGIPALVAVGLPRLGNAAFALRIEMARPSAGALFAVGATGASTPFGPCTLHLAWPFAVFSAVTDLGGLAVLPLPVPDSPALRGAVALAQAVVADPCGAWQQLLAFTNALELTLGD